MRRLLVFVCVLCAVYSTDTKAQTSSEVNQASAPPPEGRYEIIQSSLAAKVTIRLDRFSGQTSVLQTRQDSTVGWDDISRMPSPQSDAKAPGRANYQLFTSGLAIRFTFLINGCENPRAGRESGSYGREARARCRTRTTVGRRRTDGRGNGSPNPFERRSGGS